MDFLYGAAGGGVVGIIAVIFGLFAIGYIRRIIDERDALKTPRMAKLEDRLECHIRDDQSQKILAKLEAMELAGRENRNRMELILNDLTAKVDRSLQKNEAQERELTSQQRYIDNLREDLQSHVNFCAGGGAKR